MPDIRDGEITYYNQMKFLAELKKQGVTIVTRKLQKSSNEEILQKKKEIIDGLELCELCKSIITETCLGCIGKTKKREKGIDVKIAIDMVHKALATNECDCCVLISGDGDFVPALELIREKGKEAMSASVPSGYSSKLRQKNPYFILGKEKIMKCLKEYAKVENF